MDINGSLAKYVSLSGCLLGCVCISLPSHRKIMKVRYISETLKKPSFTLNVGIVFVCFANHCSSYDSIRVVLNYLLRLMRAWIRYINTLSILFVKVMCFKMCPMSTLLIIDAFLLNAYYFTTIYLGKFIPFCRMKLNFWSWYWPPANGSLCKLHSSSESILCIR